MPAAASTFKDLLLTRPEPRAGAMVGFVAAVALHVAVVPGAGALPVRRLDDRAAGSLALATHPSMPQASRVEVKLTERTSPPPPPPDVVEDVHPKGQVVDLPAATVARPDAADYLAEQNQRTERETRAREQTPSTSPTRAPSLTSTGEAQASIAPSLVKNDQSGGEPGDGAGAHGDAVLADSSDAGGSLDRSALELRKLEGRETPNLPPSATGFVPPPRPALAGNSERSRIVIGRELEANELGVGDGFAGVGRRGGSSGAGLPGHLLLDAASVARRAGMPQNDHVLVEEDDSTNLNAFEWRHAPFYNRVADAIRGQWEGGRVMRASDPDGRAYGNSDRLTVVNVVIDPDGNIVDLAVRDPSGVPPLDEEAVRALRAAGPFPHPPQALFQGGDRYAFTFGFAVNIQRTTLDLNWRPY